MPRKKLKRKSKYEIEALKEYFDLMPVWSKEIEEQIAEKLEMTVSQVKNWKWREIRKLKSKGK